MSSECGGIFSNTNGEVIPIYSAETTYWKVSLTHIFLIAILIKIQAVLSNSYD